VELHDQTEKATAEIDSIGEEKLRSCLFTGAYTSEQFAALLALEPGQDFVCEYIGVESLAKEYDRCPLYRLARR
jgi:hypothetical protein